MKVLSSVNLTFCTFLSWTWCEPEPVLRRVRSSEGVCVSRPGAEEAEARHLFDQESSKTVKQLYKSWSISADSIARAVAYAIEQPADVDVNEIVVRPVAQEF